MNKLYEILFNFCCKELHISNKKKECIYPNNLLS